MVVSEWCRRKCFTHVPTADMGIIPNGWSGWYYTQKRARGVWAVWLVVTRSCTECEQCPVHSTSTATSTQPVSHGSEWVPETPHVTNENSKLWLLNDDIMCIRGRDGLCCVLLKFCCMVESEGKLGVEQRMHGEDKIGKLWKKSIKTHYSKERKERVRDDEMWSRVDEKEEKKKKSKVISCGGGRGKICDGEKEDSCVGRSVVWVVAVFVGEIEAVGMWRWMQNVCTAPH